MANRVITIARQLGSDGGEIASRLAEKMGVPLLDREIIARAASLAGVSEETVEEAERAQSFLERMVDLLGRYPVASELGAPLPELPPTPSLTVDTYRKLIEDVICGVAEMGPAVIRGHGGQIALREDPRVLRVLICAPIERRIARLMAREGVTAEGAKKRVHDDDARVADYYRTYYKVNWTDPVLYDLVINTGRISVVSAMEIIFKAAGSA